MNTAESEEHTDTELLQRVLRAEHAAIYGYGYIGAQLSGDARERSRRYLDEHRAQRDTLRAELVKREATPAEAKSTYKLPDSTEREALDSFAARHESRTAKNYLQLATARNGALRELAARSMQAATVRGAMLGADPEPFPGFPDGTLPEENDGS